MKGELKLETPNLMLRKLTPTDVNDFLEYRGDPEVARYQGFNPMTLTEAKNFIEQQIPVEFKTPGEWYQYGIEDKSTKQIIGDGAIKFFGEDNLMAELGISLSRSRQNKGFAKETISYILSFLFQDIDFHRVMAIVDAENLNAIKLLTSLNFRQEGYFKENIFFKGRWGSEIQFAMLREDFEKKL
ncbi:MAG: GNAT family N-acetyltransferase [Ginsengibacter sp.]